MCRNFQVQEPSLNTKMSYSEYITLGSSCWRRIEDVLQPTITSLLVKAIVLVVDSYPIAKPKVLYDVKIGSIYNKDTVIANIGVSNTPLERAESWPAA